MIVYEGMENPCPAGLNLLQYTRITDGHQIASIIPVDCLLLNLNYSEGETPLPCLGCPVIALLQLSTTAPPVSFQRPRHRLPISSSSTPQSQPAI